MPDPATVKEMDLAVLKALGDETRFSMYRELATATSPLSAQELAERLGLHANTVRLHLERLREAGLVDVEPVHRGTVGRPQHLYLLAAGAPGLGFDPPSYTLPGGSAGGAGRAGRRRCRRRDRDRSRLGRRGRSAHAVASCLKALESEMRRLGFEPAVEPGDGTAEARRASRSCTARSGSSPRPIPSWSATSTGASAKASSIRSAGEEWRSSRRCTTATRAGSPCRSDILNASRSPSGGSSMSMFTVTDASQCSISPTRPRPR